MNYFKNHFSFLSGTNWLWLSIITLALILRLFLLNLNPIGLSHDDELHELINAKSLALTFAQAPGRVAGIFTPNEQCPGNCVYGELGSFIIIPWMMIFPLNLFWSKIPFVIASLAIVFFNGKLFENLSGSKKIGLLVGLLTALNPWQIHFGRTAYFTMFSYAFYLAALYFFTNPQSYKKNLLIGSLLAIIGSLFYFGTKPLLPFIVLWGVCFNLYLFKFKSFKFSLLILIFVGVFTISYLLILNQTFAGRRLQEIGVNSTEIAHTINQQRQASLEIPLVRDLAINKYSIQANTLLEKYINSFNPVFLFLKTEGSTDLYYISNQSYFYIIEFVFLIFGLLALGGEFIIGLFVLSLAGLSAFPAFFKITGDTLYAFRIAMLYPILSGIIGWGIYYIYQNLSVKNLRKFHLGTGFIVLIILIYSISLSYFLIMDWYRTPVDKAAGWYFHKRALSSYVSRAGKQSQTPVTVLSLQPDATFNTFVFFSGNYNDPSGIKKINNSFKTQNYNYENITFTGDCNKLDQSESIIIVESGFDCTPEGKYLQIANPRDNGVMYKIFSDKLCTDIPKNKYPNPRNLSDFDVENMTDQQFCRMWITDPSTP